MAPEVPPAARSFGAHRPCRRSCRCRRQRRAAMGRLLQAPVLHSSAAPCMQHALLHDALYDAPGLLADDADGMTAAATRAWALPTARRSRSPKPSAAHSPAAMWLCHLNSQAATSRLASCDAVPAMAPAEGVAVRESFAQMIAAATCCVPRGCTGSRHCQCRL